MGKKKIAGTKNVYELAQERLKVIFYEYDNIYVSFSGGKDSGVLLNMCIDYIQDVDGVGADIKEIGRAHV